MFRETTELLEKINLYSTTNVPDELKAKTEELLEEAYAKLQRQQEAQLAEMKKWSARGLEATPDANGIHTTSNKTKVGYECRYNDYYDVMAMELYGLLTDEQREELDKGDYEYSNYHTEEEIQQAYELGTLLNVKNIEEALDKDNSELYELYYQGKIKVEVESNDIIISLLNNQTEESQANINTIKDEIRIAKLMKEEFSELLAIP